LVLLTCVLRDVLNILKREILIYFDKNNCLTFKTFNTQLFR